MGGYARAADAYRELAALSTITFAGEEEGRMLVPSAGSVSELAFGVAAPGPRHAVLKLGSRGCLAPIDGTEYRQAAILVAVVDTVGAGDPGIR